jgi:hypothetical protein
MEQQMIETAEQFMAFANQQIDKNVEMLESLRSQHGDALADKAEMIMALAKHESEMIVTIASLYARADNEVTNDSRVLLDLLQLSVHAKTLPAAVMKMYMTEKEVKVAHPFISNGIENINKVVQAVMANLRG